MPEYLPFGIDQLANYPVVGLLGEPGMGKSTEIKREAQRLKAELRQTGDLLLSVDLASCASDMRVCQEIFQSASFTAWKASSARLHILLDGLDTCLLHVPTLVSLLLQRFENESIDRLSLRIASRATEWPNDLEEGLRTLWGEDGLAVIQLVPLRREDAKTIADSAGIDGGEFLREVDRVSAAQFANRPITLKPLLKSFARNRKLPAKKVDLYRAGCLDLCDEWRDDLRRTRKAMDLSTGLRFAVASRIAALGIFCRCVAIWTASRSNSVPTGDCWIEEIFGGDECFDREVARDIGGTATWAALNTGLFQSVGQHRIVFSHQTYQEFLAAYYVATRLSSAQILQLITHPDGSGKVVPQLRETAAWIAEMVPEVGQALISSDPTSVLMSDTPPSSDQSRGELMRQILRRYETEEMIELRIGGEMVWKHDRSKITYPGIADDLRPYVRDKARSLPARLIAIMAARIAELKELQQDLLHTALDDDETTKVRVVAAVTLRLIGDASSRAALKELLSVPPEQGPDEELKGAALAATWPDHLTADELFNALTPPRNTQVVTEYRRFLGDKFESHLRPGDMARALEWARPHATAKSAKHQILGISALRVVVASVDCFEEPGVCSQLAAIVAHLARTMTPVLELMSKISNNPPARFAIVRAAIEVSETEHLGALVMYGLIEREHDIPFLLSELEAGPSPSMQAKIASLIAGILRGIPWSDAQLVDRVLEASQTNLHLANAMRPVLAPMSIDSEEAELFRRLQREATRIEAPQVSTDNFPNLDLLANSSAPRRFHDICDLCERLFPDPKPGEAMPGWNHIGSDLQEKITRAAEEYLSSERVTGSAWNSSGVILSTVIDGYWALRVLAGAAPGVLAGLSEEVWLAWVPSAFGRHYAPEKPDALHTTVLQTAHRKLPERFRAVLAEFVDAQSDGSREPVILDRVPPVWDCGIADVLRSRLTAERLHPLAFRRILASLLEHADAEAITIARSRFSSATEAPQTELDKPVFASLELLASNPPGEWPAIWDMIQRNGEFAQRFFATLAVEPFGHTVSRIIRGLPEESLADMQIWLLQKAAQDGDDQTDFEPGGTGPRVGSPDSALVGWAALRNQIANSLLFRATPASTEAIGRIRKIFPNELWGRLVRDSAELVRDATWIPLSPSEFLDIALTTRRDPLEQSLSEKGNAEKAPINRGGKSGGRKGRRPNHARTEALRAAITKRGPDWRKYLPEIFEELDANDIEMGDLSGREIDVGQESIRAFTWKDLDLAVEDQRQRILDILRKYAS